MNAVRRTGILAMEITWIVAAVAIIFIALYLMRDRLRGKPVPVALRPGQALPEFTAEAEDGSGISSRSLQGTPAVLLLVRGSWCPFCSKQVKNLAGHYKAITDSGARLVLLTPKPLDTTRRVGEMFGMDFEFWLDKDLAIGRQLGLVHQAGVPGNHRDEYGEDTLWPASLVVDAAGVIRFTEVSRFIADRPNPEKLLEIVRKL